VEALGAGHLLRKVVSALLASLVEAGLDLLVAHQGTQAGDQDCGLPFARGRRPGTLLRTSASSVLLDEQACYRLA